MGMAHTEGCFCNDEGRQWKEASRSQGKAGGRQTRKSRRRKDGFPNRFQKKHPLSIPLFQTLVFKIVENAEKNSSVVVSCLVFGNLNCYDSPGKKILSNLVLSIINLLVN